MCNNLRNGKRVYKIPEWGFGYKIFFKGRKEAKTLRVGIKTVRYPKNAWIKWKEGCKEDGFCFFLSLSEAQYVLNEFRHQLKGCIIHKIRYRKGLGKRKEPIYGCWDLEEVDAGYMSSLCKEFKILGEVK